MKGRAITCSCNNAQLAWMEGPLTPAWCDIINSRSPESWLGRLPRQYTSHLDAKNLKAFSELKMSIKCIKHTERENLVTLCWCIMTASHWIIVLQILRTVAASKRYLRDMNRLQVRKSCKGFLSPREGLVGKRKEEDTKPRLGTCPWCGLQTHPTKYLPGCLATHFISASTMCITNMIHELKLYLILFTS